MSQFGPKNPAAWARPPGSGQQLNTGLFQNPLIGGQPFGAVSQIPGMINAAAFSQQAASMGVNLGMLQGPQQTLRMQTHQQPQQKKRTFSGTVTKMHDNYGFIDEDVFFQASVVRGTLPRTGDSVMVEASYNPSMPFKWNACRVQLAGNEKITPKAAPQHSTHDRNRPMISSPRGNSNLPNWNDKVSRQRSPPVRRMRSPGPGRAGPPQMGNNRRPVSPLRRSSPRPFGKRQRSPFRGDFNRGQGPRTQSPRRSPQRKHDFAKRERSPSGSLRNTSPSAKRDAVSRESNSPPRRRARVIPRYQCHIPKTPLARINETKCVTTSQIRKRYSSLYIPSDFCELQINWPLTTPIENPLPIGKSAVVYYVLHKDVDCPNFESENALSTPPDADPRFSAKVILLGHAGLSMFHQKAYGLLPDGTIDDSIEPGQITRSLNFLVGTRGKGEMTALGGSWSPSNDGENPKDPQVLIRTAIRTVRSLTGIDLSKCSRWYKVAELRYYRIEKERVDTSVLFIPDTNGLMPTDEDYRQTVSVLKNQLASKIGAVEAQGLSPTIVETPVAVGESSGCGGATVAASEHSSKEQAEEAEEEDEDDLTPTHWSKLDVKSMKVAELRQELMARDLETKGVKVVLCNRLQVALDEEKAKEESSTDEKVEKTEDIEREKEPPKKEEHELTEDEKKALEKLEKEKKDKKATLERHYTLPKETEILVYPNRIAKGGKFDCKVVSFHTLLDYRIEDCKEHSFELALLAEAVADMYDRSNAFIVYKTLHSALDKESEKKRRDDAKVAEVLGAESSNNSENQDESGDKTEKLEDDKKKEEEQREEERKKAILEPRKPVVYNRTVFQAFAHFDQNLCGYLIEKDVEEILYTIGLNLSRAQIQKLVKKCSSREKLNYRHLTDSWINKDGTVTYEPGVLPDQPRNESLIKGNILGSPKPDSQLCEAELLKSDDTVLYKGSQLNLASLIEDVSRMETDRNLALQKVCTLEVQLKESARNIQSLEKKRKRLEEDVDKYRKRLHDSEKCLKNSVDDTVQMKSTIQEFRRVGEKIISMADKIMPLPKEAEKSVSDKEDGKKEKRDEKDEKKIKKEKKDDDGKSVPNSASETVVEEKKELTLVDEVGGELMDVDAIVLKDEVEIDEKEPKDGPNENMDETTQEKVDDS